MSALDESQSNNLMMMPENSVMNTQDCTLHDASCSTSYSLAHILFRSWIDAMDFGMLSAVLV